MGAGLRIFCGYLTDDGIFFQDKKDAEMHEKFLNLTKYIEEFVRLHYDQGVPIAKTLQAWEKYKSENLR